MTIGKFVISTRKNSEFRFNPKATNGQVIGSSQMYESETSCDNGIKSVQKNTPDAAIDDQTCVKPHIYARLSPSGNNRALNSQSNTYVGAFDNAVPVLAARLDGAGE